jgi:hypothetical protein
LRDSLEEDVGQSGRVLPLPWAGEADFPNGAGRVEWAALWLDGGGGFLNSYCNTVPTPLGGTHEAGLRSALLKGLRAWGEHRGNRRAAQLTAEDVLTPMAAKLSVFIRACATASTISWRATRRAPTTFWPSRSNGPRSASAGVTRRIRRANRRRGGCGCPAS